MLKPPPPPPTRHKPAPLPAMKDYSQILKDCGYPQRVLVLDFEMFFSPTYSLKTLSIPAYIADPQFEVLGLAIKNGDLPAYFLAGEKDVEEYLRAVYAENVTIIMQNAPFDAMVLAMRYDIHPPFIIDTANLAKAWHTRSRHGLADLAKQWGLVDKGKTSDFLNCTRRTRYQVNKKGPPTKLPLMTSAQEEAIAGYAKHDAELTWDIFKILLPRLSNPKTELRIMDHTLRLWTKPVLRCDMAHGAELRKGMEAEVQKLLDLTGHTQDEISGDKSFDALLTTALEQAGDNPMNYTKFMKSGVKFELAKDDPGLARLKVHPDGRVRNLIAARTGIRSWPGHMSRVDNILAMATACGGDMPIPLRYHGAHTGRFSGAEGVNPQNLAKRGHPLLVGMRGLFAARPGDALAIVDLAAIEARVLAYLAGEQELVNAFAGGADVYCLFGSIFYGVPVRKPRKDDLPPIAALMKARRDFSKVCILGMGYGMGKDRFAEYASCDAATAERAVRVYRDKYTAITGLWRAIERAFVFTAKYHKPCAMDRGLSFHSTDDVDVVITLPNGRRLNYHRVKLEAGQYGDQASVYNDVEHGHDRLWGGVLTENVVQAVSRDVLTEAMLRLEDQGYHTALHVHDELVIATSVDKAQDVLALAVKELSRSPTWAPGLPLNAEGVVSERYGLH